MQIGDSKRNSKQAEAFINTKLSWCLKGFTQQLGVDFVHPFTCGKFFLGGGNYVCSSKNGFEIISVGHKDGIPECIYVVSNQKDSN